MQLTGPGLLSLAAILIAPFATFRTLLFLFVPTCLLMASAAIFIGDNGVTPAHLMLIALFILLLRQPSALHRLKAVAGRSLPGTALVALAAYGIALAMFYPRLFPGSTAANMFSSSDPAAFLAPPPLQPSSANVTQSIYILGSFSVFFMLLACCESVQHYKSLILACCIAAVCNVLFGAVDLLTYYTGTEFILDSIHNGNYLLHTSETAVLGLKRISGSFTETSAFSATTLGFFAFTLQLALRGIYRPAMLALSALELVFLLLSTSSTGLIGIGVVIPACWIVAAWRSFRGQAQVLEACFTLLAPLAGLALVSAIVLYEPARDACRTVIESVLLDKAQSESGVERLMLNAQAVVNFFDSAGLGIGIGSVRTSSFAFAIIASVGVPGTLLFALFLAPVLFSRNPQVLPPTLEAWQGACRFACFALLVAACVSATSMDLNLLFFVFAAGAFWPCAVGGGLLSVRPPRVRSAVPSGLRYRADPV